MVERPPMRSAGGAGLASAGDDATPRMTEANSNGGEVDDGVTNAPEMARADSNGGEVDDVVMVAPEMAGPTQKVAKSTT